MLADKEHPEQNEANEQQEYEDKKDKTIRMQDWFDSSIEQHDLFDFEIKMEYDLYKSSPVNNFALSIYFFTPQSLQINAQTYTKERFYADMNAHIRFKTPKISLEGILNEKNQLSPLTRIIKNLDDVKNGKCDEEICDSITTEIRVLGSVLKVTLRDQIHYFIEQLDNESIAKEDLMNEIEEYLTEIENLQSNMRGLEQQFFLAQIPVQVREAFNYADQYTTLQIIDNLVSMLKVFQKIPSANYLCDHIIKVIENEQKKPHKMKNLLQIQEGGINESFIYHEGIFKKYLQNVLYLNKRIRDVESKALQGFYAIASAIAMSFYLIATFYISINPNEPLGEIFFFGLLTVFFYVIREQLKSIIQAVSSKFVRNAFPDKRYDLIDQHDQSIGKVKESMTFLNWKAIPQEILKIRQSSNFDLIEQEGKPESVFKFMKDITLLSDPIAALHDRFGDVNDIIRFNVRNFITYADDPDRTVSIWDMKNQTIKDVHCEKSYHLNLIIKLEAKDNVNRNFVSYRKVRVILDQRGIKRVQEMKFKLKS
jgi:hypothetical protein